MLIRRYLGRKVGQKVGGGYGLWALCLTLVLSPALPAQAFQFEYGELQGSLDTTLSYGVSWRVDDRDKEILGVAGTPESGSGFSVNNDDGNQNYATGVVSNVGKITSELDLRYGNFGGFFRGSAFYDYFTIMKMKRAAARRRLFPTRRLTWSAVT